MDLKISLSRTSEVRDYFAPRRSIGGFLERCLAAETMLDRPVGAEIILQEFFRFWAEDVLETCHNDSLWQPFGRVAYLFPYLNCTQGYPRRTGGCVAAPPARPHCQAASQT